MKSMGENRTATSTDGTRIAFTKIGSGPSLILVDGAFCYRENGPASKLAPLLARHFTVFSYDRRGRGESGDTPPYAIEKEVEDLRALIKEAGGSASVLAISSGAAVALQAVARGASIARLALYEPPFVTEGGQPRTYEVANAQLDHLLSNGDRAGAVKFFLTDVIGVPRPFALVMPLLMRNAWKKNKAVAHTLKYDLKLLSDWSVLNGQSASVPTLVVGGEKSPQLLRDAVSMVAAAIPGSRTKILAGQNHNFSPATLAPVVDEFLQGN
jgi:pimeloyl-ACP methyl ester carboxylesterase